MEGFLEEEVPLQGSCAGRKAGLETTVSSFPGPRSCECAKAAPAEGGSLATFHGTDVLPRCTVSSSTHLCVQTSPSYEDTIS